MEDGYSRYLLGAVRRKERKEKKPKTIKNEKKSAFPTNPGKIEYLFHKNKHVFELPKHCFMGLQLNLQNVMDQQPDTTFLTLHHLAIGNKEPVDPVTGKKTSDEKCAYNFMSYLKAGNWTFNGRTAPGYALRSFVGYERGPISGECKSKFDSEGMKFIDLDLALKIKDCCLQGKWYHEPTSPSDQKFSVAYTQHVTDTLYFGTQFTLHQKGNHLKYLFKYDNFKTYLTSSIGFSSPDSGPSVQFNEFTIAHGIPFSESIDTLAGIEFTRKNSTSPWESLVKFGYIGNYLPRRENPKIFPIRGYMDSRFRGACIMEEQLSESASIVSSVEVDFPKNTYHFGLGLNLHM